MAPPSRVGGAPARRRPGGDAPPFAGRDLRGARPRRRRLACASSPRSSTSRTRSSPTPWRRCACRRTPSCSHASASAPSGRPTFSRGSASATSGRERSSPAARRTRSCRCRNRSPPRWALMFAITAHVVDWPVPRAARRRSRTRSSPISGASAAVIETGRRIERLADLPHARVVLFDTSPDQLAHIAGDALPAGYRRRLGRYRYGPGVFKLDWALDGPIPWRDPACREASTVHIGGTLAEICASERDMYRGRHSERPFLILCQQSEIDAGRAPAGRHTGWAYCHVPHASTVDMTDAIESQVERFAPGFRDRILARHALSPADLERYNPNYRGGAITGGVADALQFWNRPVTRLDPYATPNPQLVHLLRSDAARRRASTACAAGGRRARRWPGSERSREASARTGRRPQSARGAHRHRPGTVRGQSLQERRAAGVVDGCRAPRPRAPDVTPDSAGRRGARRLTARAGRWRRSHGRRCGRFDAAAPPATGEARRRWRA